jgi:hypothetical protein
VVGTAIPIVGPRPQFAGGEPVKFAARAGRGPFDELRKTAFGETLRAALRLGHSYIGTERILLGVLRQKGDAATTREGLGLGLESTEAAVSVAIEKLKS